MIIFVLSLFSQSIIMRNTITILGGGRGLCDFLSLRNFPQRSMKKEYAKMSR